LLWGNWKPAIYLKGAVGKNQFAKRIYRHIKEKKCAPRGDCSPHSTAETRPAQGTTAYRRNLQLLNLRALGPLKKRWIKRSEVMGKRGNIYDGGMKNDYDWRVLSRKRGGESAF